MGIVSVLLVLAALLVSVPAVAAAPAATEEKGWQEVGLRAGTRAGSDKKPFQLYELYAVYGLPWEWRTSSGWGAETRAAVSAGALTTRIESGFIGSVGTSLLFNRPGPGPGLELAIKAAMTDRRSFGDHDLGSALLFGGSAGLSWRFESGLRIGYRLEHLSNGHIFYSRNTPNPGIDLHMLDVGWNW